MDVWPRQDGDQCADTDGMALNQALGGLGVGVVSVLGDWPAGTLESCYDNGHLAVIHNDWPAPVPSRLHELARRVEELEAENAHLLKWADKIVDDNSALGARNEALSDENERLRAGEERSGGPQRLSASWHHLPCVTAPVRDHAALFRAIRK